MNEQNTIGVNQNEVTEAEKKEKLDIVVETKERFGDEGIKTELLTSVDLCQKISAIFGEVYSDYVGCKIKVNDARNSYVNKYVGGYGIPYVEIYFKDMPKGNGFKAIKSRTQETQSRDDNGGRRLINTIGPRSSLCYTVMPEVYEGLEKFIKPPVPNTKINWNEIITEVQEVMNMYNMDRRELLVCVTGVSLRALIEEIYGVESEDGARLDYDISVVNKIMSYNNGGQDNGYIFAINQLNNNLVAKLNRELGRNTNVNYLYQEYRR